jgi:hypothetical protein
MLFIKLNSEVMRNVLTVVLCLMFYPLSGQKFVANYDESKVPGYTLPDPLVFNDGSEVKSKKDWKKRRSEIMDLFLKEVYGINPEWKGKLTATEVSVNNNALNGKAVRKEIKISLKNDNKELDFIMLLYLPHSSQPVPVFLGYNFGGNHTVTDEIDISVNLSLLKGTGGAGTASDKVKEIKRGTAASSWQVSEIISRGYGLATIHRDEVDPDFDDGFKNGVHSLFDRQPDNTSWGTIAAWAWGLSRAMDYLETNSSVDSKRVIVMGHSRLGKTALWAGATDERFAMVISNNSGCGGAALSMRILGETVGSINRAFPHWFCENFNKYNENEKMLPVDQHELIALIAPRPVYVASAQEDLWADPKGEFLSCVGASPVYYLLTKKSFPAIEMPAVHAPVISKIGYHIREGKHNVTLYDWQQYLDFADLHLRKK